MILWSESCEPAGQQITCDLPLLAPNSNPGSSHLADVISLQYEWEQDTPDMTGMLVAASRGHTDLLSCFRSSVMRNSFNRSACRDTHRNERFCSLKSRQEAYRYPAPSNQTHMRSNFSTASKLSAGNMHCTDDIFTRHSQSSQSILAGGAQKCAEVTHVGVAFQYLFQITTL